MELFVADHPLISHKLSLLRNKDTPNVQFRQLVEEVVELLTFEATKGLKTESVEIETPLTTAEGARLAGPRPLVIPILRAGLGMLPGIMRLIPAADVGFLGIKRNEKTLAPETYANRLPNDLSGRSVILIDPMLATGGTLIDSLDYAFERGAVSATCMCLLGAPEGVMAVDEHVSDQWAGKEVTIYLGALDTHLNAAGFIVPGLGDAGDRLFGE